MPTRDSARCRAEIRVGTLRFAHPTTLLAAAQGTLEFSFDGSDETDAQESVAALIAARFHEDS